MKKINILLKKDILSILDSIGLNKHSAEYKDRKAILLVIFFSFSVTVMYYFFITYSKLFSSGYELSGVALGKGIAFGILFLTNIYFLYELIGNEEYLLLNNLPIRKEMIVVSKILTVYMCSYILELIVFIPLFFVIGLRSLLINVLISFFMLPIATVFISILILYFFEKFWRSIKLGIIPKTILSFIVICSGVIILISSRINFELITIKGNFRGGFWILNQIYILMLLVIVGGFGSISFLGSILENDFKRGLSFSSFNPSSSLYVYVPKTKFISILVGEIKQYASLLPYVLNTALGLILVVFFSSNYFLWKLGVGNNLLGIPNGFIRQKIYTIPYIMSLIIGMCCTTQVSVSLEGKCVWIKKMLPVNAKMVYLSKLLLSLMLMIPVAVISIVFLMALEDINKIDMLLSLVIIISNIVFISLAGLYIDIKFGNYRWNNPTSTIKRSLTSILYQLVNLLINIFCIGILSANEKNDFFRIMFIFITMTLIIFIYQSIVNKEIPDY